jgi:hypothetical protein
LGSLICCNRSTDDAILWLEKARTANPAGPRFSCEHRSHSGHRTLGVPKIRALAEATYLAGLRKAGMPEE